jgi:maltokinase
MPTSSEVIGLLTGTAGSAERPITVDQTNRSVVVDERYVVKWLAAPVLSPMHGVEMRRHLAHSGFDEMPGLIGAYEHDTTTYAIVTEFVAGALDGWDWLVDDVLAWLSGSLERRALLDTCALVGGLVGRFLLAMSRPSALWSRPTTLSTAEMSWWHDRGQVLLNEAHALEPALMEAVGDEVAQRLSALSMDHPTGVQWIHGDVHVGQVLRANGQLWLTDFDGDPLSGPPEPRTPVRDVVGLLQSLDHVGRIVNRRTEHERATEVEAWIDDAIDVAYRAVIEASGPIDERLIGPLSVMQELHEVVYAARHLPRWRYVPAVALPAVLARY